MTAVSRRSSASGDRRGLVAAGVALAALALAGCGEDSRREQVEGFLREVNAVQEKAAPDFARANRSYARFARGELPAAGAERELARAERAMRDTRDRIDALDAPADARELQRRLVLLFDADAALASESRLLAAFAPGAQKAVEPLPRLAQRLSRRLSRATTPRAQQSALRDYADGVGGAIRRLQRLHPPPILVERHHEQVEHLRRVRGLSAQLVRALSAQDEQRVARLLLRFRRLASRRAGVVDPRSLDEYMRRYRGIQRRMQSVERERSRLERELVEG